jgi:hypothetical protein
LFAPNNSAPTDMMARAAGLGWTTVETILCHRPVKHRIDETTLKLARNDYTKLSAETAERTLRFWQLHNKVDKQVSM